MTQEIPDDDIVSCDDMSDVRVGSVIYVSVERIYRLPI